MSKMALCLLGATLSLGQIGAQAPAELPETASPQTTVTRAPQDAAYRNSDLGIVFLYPPDLVLGDEKSVADRGHRAIYGNDPESDPEHVKSEKCMHPLMMADVPTATAPAALTLGEAGKPSAQVDPPPVGSILFAEIDKSCLPKKMSTEDMNDALGNLASIAQKIPGMTPIDQQMWYEVDKHKVHFSAAHGRLSANRPGGGMTESSQEQAVATLSVESKGHLVLWMIMANSGELVNRLLTSKVQFSGGQIVPLFPFSIGDGPPVKLVP